MISGLSGLNGLSLFRGAKPVDLSALSPSGMLGLVFHLRADTLSLSESGQVSVWNDISGSGADVSTITADNRPVYRSTFQQVGLPAVQGDRTNDDLNNGTACNFRNFAGFTVFAVVFNTDNTGAANEGIIGRDRTNNRGWLLSVDDATGKAVFIVSTGTNARRRRDGDKYDCRLFPCVITGRYNGPAAEQSLWVNGVLDNGSIDGAVPALVANSGDLLRVFNNGFAEPFGGGIFEIAVFNRALPDNDRIRIEKYFKQTYGMEAWVEGFVSPDMDSHQGYTFATTASGDFHYTIHTDAIFKRTDDASWTSVLSNTNPFSGLAGLNHLGDGDYYDEKLYIPAENWGGSCGSFSNQRILVFNAADLTRISDNDISAQGHEVSAVAVNADDGIIYVCSYCDGTQLWKYSLTDFGFQGTLALSETINAIQGMDYHDGYIYLSTSVVGGTEPDAGRLIRLKKDGTELRTFHHDSRRSGTIFHEGIHVMPDGTIRLVIEEGTSQRVFYMSEVV